MRLRAKVDTLIGKCRRTYSDEGGPESYKGWMPSEYGKAMDGHRKRSA